MSYYYKTPDGREVDIEEMYRNLLDEVYGDVSVGSMSWSASQILEAMDPIAYRIGLHDYLDEYLDEYQGSLDDEV